MYSVGSIIIVKNIIFKNGNGNFDHSYKNGRPCLVISITDDKVYFVTLSSKNYGRKYDSEIEINSKYCKKNSIVKVGNIYCRDRYYYEEKFKLSDVDLLKILKYFYQFQISHLCDDLFSEIMLDIQNTIDVISSRLDTGKRLVYKNCIN